MVHHVLRKESYGFDWYDITRPVRTDFDTLREPYQLLESTIDACLEPGHLPTREVLPAYDFLILRLIRERYPENSDVLTELTDRISIICREDVLITCHLAPLKRLEKIKEDAMQPENAKNTRIMISLLIFQSLKTFEQELINSFSGKLDEYEEYVFLHSRRKPFLKKLYYLKRQIDLIRIILTLYKDLVDELHPPRRLEAYSPNLRELYNRTNTLYRNIGENTAQLLSVYFNIESNHTNEIMRTLTVFSVFFMPLTFIVGVYGMNFKYMPELEWKYSYPAVMVLMALLSAGIYVWFKRKKWL